MEKYKKIGFGLGAFTLMYVGAGLFQCGMSDYCAQEGSFGQVVDAVSISSDIEGAGNWAGPDTPHILIEAKEKPKPPPPTQHSH